MTTTMKMAASRRRRWLVNFEDDNDETQSTKEACKKGRKMVMFFIGEIATLLPKAK